jgi:hypothetical protein
MEIWKEVKGYDGYLISNLGNVKSFRRNREKLLNPSIDGSGYLTVSLYDNKIKRTKKIHQLVAIAFLNHNNCGYKLVVNHINFNKLDNNVSNLEVVTARVNCNRKHLKSSSKYTGVGWHKQHLKWHSQIVIDKKKVHLGYFANEIDASNAYQEKLLSIQ